jgi:hypothetical protein
MKGARVGSRCVMRYLKRGPGTGDDRDGFRGMESMGTLGIFFSGEAFGESEKMKGTVFIYQRQLHACLVHL